MATSRFFLLVFVFFSIASVCESSLQDSFLNGDTISSLFGSWFRSSGDGGKVLKETDDDAHRHRGHHHHRGRKLVGSSARIGRPPLSESCDLYNGRWVVDHSRPLYQAFGEKKDYLIQKTNECARLKKLNLQYEHYRWQPFDCNLPTFDGQDFLLRMKDKTIAFFGDSLARGQFASLFYLIGATWHPRRLPPHGTTDDDAHRHSENLKSTESNTSTGREEEEEEEEEEKEREEQLASSLSSIGPVEDVAVSRFGSVKAWDPVRRIFFMAGVTKAYLIVRTNTTFIYYTERVMAERIHVDDNSNSTQIEFGWDDKIKKLDSKCNGQKYIMNLDRPIPFLQDHARDLDVVVVSSKHHWNRGKPEILCSQLRFGGVPVKPTDPWFLPEGARGKMLEGISRWMDDHLRLGNDQQLAFVRSMSPPHFVHGAWNKGGTCNKFKSILTRSAVSRWGLIRRDEQAEDAISGTRVKLLNITYLSSFRAEAHPSDNARPKDLRRRKKRRIQDCLHWCLPGVVDTWNEILYAEIILASRRNPRWRPSELPPLPSDSSSSSSSSK